MTMKKILFTIILLAGICMQAVGQIDLMKEKMDGSTLVVMPGQILEYEVNAFGSSYMFTVYVKSVKDGVTFEYEMTNDEKTKGIVHISKEAMEKAIEQMNKFSGGEVRLENRTTVWVSEKVFNNLISTGKAKISTDSGKSHTIIQGAEARHDFSIYNAISNKKFDDISYVYAQSEDGSAKYWIHLSERNPLILKMDLGWTITLKKLRME